MYYYLVSKIGSGTDTDPYRPDVPIGTSYVGQECPYNKMLIKTINQIPNLVDIPYGSELENVCYNNRIKYGDVVLDWFLG